MFYQYGKKSKYPNLLLEVENALKFGNGNPMFVEEAIGRIGPDERLAIKVYWSKATCTYHMSLATAPVGMEKNEKISTWGKPVDTGRDNLEDALAAAAWNSGNIADILRKGRSKERKTLADKSLGKDKNNPMVLAHHRCDIYTVSSDCKYIKTKTV